MKIFKPTIGLGVYFHPASWRGGDEQPLAAFVTYVWSDTCVNLAIFDRNGTPMSHPPTRVLVVHTGEKPPEDDRIPYCTRRSYKPDLPAPVAEKVARRRSTATSDFA